MVIIQDMKLLKKILHFPRNAAAYIIGLYRRFLSPLKGTPTCRFAPTCSEYAVQALKEWGLIIGTFLAVWRILRCNPFGKPGYDPVPKRKRKIEFDEIRDNSNFVPYIRKGKTTI